jgi:hypothetical protein
MLHQDSRKRLKSKTIIVGFYFGGAGFIQPSFFSDFLDDSSFPESHDTNQSYSFRSASFL